MTPCAVLSLLALGELVLRFRYRQKATRSIPEPPGAPRIVAFGDSIVAGSPGSVDEAWPARLQERLVSAYPVVPWSVVNAGVSGDTTSKGYARFERDVVVHRPDVVMIAFGLNDCYPVRQGLDGWLEGEVRGSLGNSFLLRALASRTMGWARKLAIVSQPEMEPASVQPRTSPEGFTAALAFLIDRCRAIGAEPVLLGMTPLGSGRLEGVRLRLPLYLRYNAITEEIAERKSAKWVDLSGPGSGDLLQDDGFHLTPAGQCWVADRIFAELECEGFWARKAQESD